MTTKKYSKIVALQFKAKLKTSFGNLEQSLVRSNKTIESVGWAAQTIRSDKYYAIDQK